MKANEATTRDRPCDLRPAVAPPEAFGRARDEVRLLVTSPDGDIEAAFADLPRFLDPGDLVVLNTSGTRRAAIDLDHSPLTLHVSSPTPDGDWIVEFRTADGRRPHRGPVPTISTVAGASLHVVAPYNDDRPSRLWRARADGDLDSLLATHGRFVRYDYLQGGVDDGWYQNVYATTPGSAEMASAGRPITRLLLETLRRRGVRIASLVLHCGVSSQELGETPHTEYYEIGSATMDAVHRARADGRRIVAVGTTVVRALETAARTSERAGWTSLLLGDQTRPVVVDAMLSGFHPPEASHLDLLGSLVGPQTVRRAYDRACADGFTSHEFGDSHLLFAR